MLSNSAEGSNDRVRRTVSGVFHHIIPLKELLTRICVGVPDVIRYGRGAVAGDQHGWVPDPAGLLSIRPMPAGRS